jgi:hypothetical protein
MLVELTEIEKAAACKHNNYYVYLQGSHLQSNESITDLAFLLPILPYISSLLSRIIVMYLHIFQAHPELPQ